MAASVRYRISAYPAPQSNGLSSDGRILQTGKLSSSSASQLSTIITVPAAPNGMLLNLNVYAVFTDPAAKTGGNAAFLIVSEHGVDPVLTASEGTVDPTPRLAMRAAGQAFGPGDAGFDYTVRPGQRFAIQDTGWAP